MRLPKQRETKKRFHHLINQRLAAASWQPLEDIETLWLITFLR